MKTNKYIELTEGKQVWHIPLHVICDNRASYYAEKEGQENYQPEYDFAANDSYEAIDWFQNNMDWSDVADVAVMQPTKITSEPEDFCNAEMHIINPMGGI